MKQMLLCFLCLMFVFSPALAQQLEHRTDAISGGAEAARLGPRAADLMQLQGSPIDGPFNAPFIPGIGFLGYNFDDNGTETGYLFIPPDPIGAAGQDRLISVVNTGIECRNKTGTLLWRDSLKDFFSSLNGTLNTFTFDPKVVYDHYENRFVVVTLERWFASQGDPQDDSRILVAVSKTSTPATATSSDWWYLAINSKVNIGGTYHWADYPGFEVDEEAIYITNNMFTFAGAYGEVRLWIIDKGVVGGFYANGSASWAIHDPIPAGSYDMTTQPALVFGAGGAGTNIGTYLVGYSSLTTGGPGGIEYAQIIRIDNPLSSPPTFTGQLVALGDLENVGGTYGWPAIPDAPQSGTSYTIEVNDSRALDAVWRNNNLWVTTTINPNTGYDATNSGQATAHWFRFNTTTPASITLADQGNIGGEDIATGTWTFFPAVAVNSLGDAWFGFSASASSIYGGAYYAGREASDPAGTVQASGTVQAGTDYYNRTFGGSRNRWGDYSGAAVDPSDDLTFWIYNEYAMDRGSGTPPEDGRWGTAWRSCLKQQTIDWGDAPDQPYPTLSASNGANHQIVQGVNMGALIDGEADGQPSVLADGDDLNSLADEDGVVMLTPMVQGQPASIQVTVTVAGWVDAWIDFNNNGSWLDTGENIYSGAVAAGPNPINFNVPASAVPGMAYARVRFHTGAFALAPTGPAQDGEVEDYRWPVEESQDEYDFGDAPDGPYPTLLGSSGAYHLINPAYFMGGQIDAEVDGQPDATATGDDTSNQPDEDGVMFLTPFIPGLTAQVDVICSLAGYLDIWFDFDNNGNWTDPYDHVYSGGAAAGSNIIPIPVPATAQSGPTFARFRYNSSGALPFTGMASDGEVEDHLIPIEELDFGDAPDPTYPVLIASNGAAHAALVGSYYLGNTVDVEPDGQPDPNALGDDNNNQPDEDGVFFTSPINPQNWVSVDVIASTNGFLDAWIDWDNNGSWDASEQIFASKPLVTGLNSIGFVAGNTGTTAFVTFARFRFSSTGGLSPTGVAGDGEVEDYEVFVEDDNATGAQGTGVPTEFALHEAYPNPFNPNTTLAFSLPEESQVKLTIYDVNGRLVRTLLDEKRGAARHEIIWWGRDDKGREVASGVYFYRIDAGSFTQTKRMVLVK